MRRALLATVALLACSAPAFALQVPRPGPRDPRMRTAEYDPQEVYKLVATLRTTVQIVFPKGENVLGGTSGDTQAWEVVPVQEQGGNIVTVKAKDLRGGLPTNIQIVSKTAAGELHTYQFEAVARDGTIADSSSDVMLSVTFIDRMSLRQEAAERAAVARAEAQERRAQDRLEVSSYYGPRNWLYSATQGQLRAGLEVSDNGVQTVFRFVGTTAVPAIFLVNGKDEERVQTVPRGEEVIVPMTAPLFRLRLGDAVLDVRNDAYSPAGIEYGTGTSSPGIVREPRRHRRTVRSAAR